jgi:hypothetical protein
MITKVYKGKTYLKGDFLKIEKLTREISIDIKLMIAKREVRVMKLCVGDSYDHVKQNKILDDTIRQDKNKELKDNEEEQKKKKKIFKKKKARPKKK